MAAGLRVATLLSALASAAVPAPPDPSPVPVPEPAMAQVFDPERSQARFRVKLRILRGATGHFLDVRGELRPEGERQRVAVEVDGRQLRIEGPAWMDRVTRSKDFLDVQRHPNIRFVSAPFVPKLLRDGGEMRGDLTLRGVTRGVAFRVEPATCEVPGRDCEIAVTGSVSRHAFGMNAYRLTVRDEVDFEFHVRLREEVAP